MLVYIHGGSYMTGSNTDASTDGEAYAHHGVITVAINYRLGPFHSVWGDGYTGNLALTDQLTALRWVKDNIADYGGDPERITVMGESAGAVSVQNLLISPLVEDGLISGAIMLSGGGSLSEIGSPTVPALVEPIWTKVKQDLGVDSLDELKDLPAQELYAAWVAALGAYAGTATTPVLDGVALVDNVDTALDNNTVKTCLASSASSAKICGLIPCMMPRWSMGKSGRKPEASRSTFLTLTGSSPAKISLGHFTPQTCIMCSVHSTGTGGPLTTQITVLRRT